MCVFSLRSVNSEFERSTNYTNRHQKTKCSQYADVVRAASAKHVIFFFFFFFFKVAWTPLRDVFVYINGEREPALHLQMEARQRKRNEEFNEISGI